MEKFADWREGAEHFNQGRYWDAHEAWERGWLGLPPAEKLHVQAMIQVAAVMHHLVRGTTDPARRLAALALEKLADGKLTDEPRIIIEGAEGFLRHVLAGASAEAGKSLRARVE